LYCRSIHGTRRLDPPVGRLLINVFKIGPTIEPVKALVHGSVAQLGGRTSFNKIIYLKK